MLFPVANQKLKVERTRIALPSGAVVILKKALSLHVGVGRVVEAKPLLLQWR
jgi:hypothetical protein